jgi:uncharacterized membrane protein YhaH (DUF805 family)
MKNIIQICFERWGVINRKEYFLGNIFLVFLCVFYAFIFIPLLMPLTSGIEGMWGIVLSIVPCLLFFSYSSFCLILKRGKDFWAHSFLVYLFFGATLFITFGPSVTLFFIEFMLSVGMLLFGIILNISWCIMWIVFQSVATKKV